LEEHQIARYPIAAGFQSGTRSTGQSGSSRSYPRESHATAIQPEKWSKDRPIFQRVHPEDVVFYRLLSKMTAMKRRYPAERDPDCYGGISSQKLQKGFSEVLRILASAGGGKDNAFLTGDKDAPFNYRRPSPAIFRSFSF
jgi:hypothetical protein